MDPTSKYALCTPIIFLIDGWINTLCFEGSNEHNSRKQSNNLSLSDMEEYPSSNRSLNTICLTIFSFAGLFELAEETDITSLVAV